MMVEMLINKTGMNLGGVHHIYSVWQDVTHMKLWLIWFSLEAFLKIVMKKGPE